MDTWNNKADETLVALYAKGENQAFNVLLNRYKDKLYTYIYYIVRNSEMTEDIFQETFMKAINCSHSFHRNIEEACGCGKRFRR